LSFLCCSHVEEVHWFLTVHARRCVSLSVPMAWEAQDKENH
jgi:hypothetical protein